LSATFFDKVWQHHAVAQDEHGETLLYIDRIVLHERTGTIALNTLTDRNLPVRLPKQTICVMDHIVDTRPGRGDATSVPGGDVFITSTRTAAREHGLEVFDLDHPQQGISHLVSAEQGFALPGATLVCPDSHTCTLGALGALAFGIGTSQAEHALATRTLRLMKPGNMRVQFVGAPPADVHAKDLALYLIAKHGTAAASGRTVEFAGDAVMALDMAGRMTLCNLAVEFSAFTAMIAPDSKTVEYVQGRPMAPDSLPVAQWQQLASDPEATFEEDLIVQASSIRPRTTWGTSPEHGMAVDGCVPKPSSNDQARALAYIDLAPGQRLQDVPINAAYIGSCTNARLEDLRVAANVLKGRRVACSVRALCVPASMQVKRAAEQEGLDRVFKDAGFEWREPGCGMCFYAGGEHLGEGSRVISTTNRNFEGRQGPNIRTHLASPATVAASAIVGRFATEAML